MPEAEPGALLHQIKSYLQQILTDRSCSIFLERAKASFRKVKCPGIRCFVKSALFEKNIIVIHKNGTHQK